MKLSDTDLSVLLRRLRVLQGELEKHNQHISRLVSEKRLGSEYDAAVQKADEARTEFSGLQTIYLRAGGPRWNRGNHQARLEAYLLRQQSGNAAPAPREVEYQHTASISHSTAAGGERGVQE